jgi:Tfp pilus assembly protein PilF/glutathione synthase/RimK-type ligase-like ATP-grasp enzyme
MADWAPRQKLEDELKVAEARLAAGEKGPAAQYMRASFLHLLGRHEDAKAAYLAVLQMEPGHHEALIRFAALLRDTDFRTAAQSVYRQCMRLYPDDTRAPVGLGNVLLDQGDFAGARPHYEAALALDPGCLEAHQGLAMVLMELREEAAALEHGRQGFAGRAVVSNPYRGQAEPVRVLVLNSVGGGNIPLRRSLDDTVFQATLCLAEFQDPSAPLPEHQVVFNAIGDADHCGPGLKAALGLLARTQAPVLNPPGAVALTGRAANAKRLGALEGVAAPRTEVFSREALAGPEAATRLAAAGFIFPLLLRALGYQAGKHFVKVEQPVGLAAALDSMPGQDFAVIQFLDARGRDGKLRKYRVMMIGGALLPLHAAISTQWKIHYFSADMSENAEHRAEDEAFLNGMPSVLGPRAMAALGRIQEALGLDYCGVDFGLDADGRLLLFEANATMVVLPASADEKWAYRRAPVQRALDALTRLLLSKAGHA